MKSIISLVFAVAMAFVVLAIVKKVFINPMSIHGVNSVKSYVEKHSSRVSQDQKIMQATGQKIIKSQISVVNGGDAENSNDSNFEIAWSNSGYAAPKFCDTYTSEKVMVQCVNHKMLAKRKFREKYYGGGK